MNLLQEATDELRATADEVLSALKESEFLEFDETPDTIKLSTRNYEFEKGMVYHNFSVNHRLLVDECWCSFADFKQFVFDYQFLGFYGVESRNRIREAFVKLRGLAPFSPTTRFPNDFFVLLIGPLRSHFQQLMHAVDLPDPAFGYSNVGSKHGITNTNDAKSSLDVAFQRLATVACEINIRKLRNQGVYHREAFEEVFGLEWRDS